MFCTSNVFNSILLVDAFVIRGGQTPFGVVSSRTERVALDPGYAAKSAERFVADWTYRYTDK